MQTLEIKGTSETPGILLDGQNGTFEISGRALVTDARSFFKPALEWLHEYANAPRPATRLTVKLEYLNNESSKVILDFLTILEKVNGSRVYWYFKEDDEDMEEAGEELAELVNVPFEFKTY
jgi:hypothetical protein